MRIVVTGPAEAATPLVAAALAAHLRARFLDTGEFYPARVRPGGPPLGEIWLEALALAFTRERSLVASSGSLTRLRRDEIRARVPGVVFVELVVFVVLLVVPLICETEAHLDLLPHPHELLPRR